MKKYLIFFLVAGILTLAGCGIAKNNPNKYTCENMMGKFSCEGMTAETCSKDSYVQWAMENCGLGTEGKEIGL